MTFPLPPTRHYRDGIPYADANLLAAAVGALNLRLIYVDFYGADPTGATFSDAAFAAAFTAAGSGPWQMIMGAGNYKLANSYTFGRNQGLTGPGSAVCSITYTGNGVCLTASDSSFSSSLSVAGRFGGFNIDGSAAGANAEGMSSGNLLRARCHDLRVANFTGASAVGVRFKNTASGSTWYEEAEWTGINVNNCTVCVLFDTGSFDYSVYEFMILANAGQDGIRLQNDASLEGCRLEVRGNFKTGTPNTASVISLDPGNAAGTSRIDGCLMYVNVECDGTTGTGHFTLSAAGSSTSQFTGTGVLQFNDETVAFQGANIVTAPGPQFGFSGRVVDHVLGTMSPGDGLAVQGGTLWNQTGSLTTALPSTIFLKSGDIQAYQLANGVNTVVFGSVVTRVRRLELFLAQPASGGAGTVTWPANVYFQAGKPNLSSANGAIDRVRLTFLPADNKWLGEVVTGYVLASSATAAGQLQKVADTGTAGYTLVNGTGNILSWTAPNDGQQHAVLVICKLKVTSDETGGLIGVNHTGPDGTGRTTNVVAQQLAGYFTNTPVPFLIAPNTTITLQQTSALTAGASVLYAQLWAA